MGILGLRKNFIGLVVSAIAGLFLLLNLGCHGLNPLGNSPSVKAPSAKPAAESSVAKLFFVLAAENPVYLAGHRFGIYKSGLKQEILLRTEIIAQAEVPMFQGLKSRVVSFERHGSELFLLQATKGHVVSESTDETLILTSFTIIEETEDLIIFDFSAGMSQIFQARDWTTSDFPADFPPMKASVVKRSFLKQAHFSLNNELVVEQSAQVEERGSLVPVALKYYLTPYMPDPTYQPFFSAGVDRVGYFEVAPVLNAQGGLNQYASRFHPDHPIQFAISANTPEPFVEAIRQGILYWNKGFGYDKIQVVMAPKTIRAPHPNYNVVQWVDWDMAGFAYADAQMDPRTGQILNAQIFLTSAFAHWSEFRKLWILQQQKQAENPTAEASKLRGLAGFESSLLCHMDLSKQMASTGLDPFMQNGTANKDILLKLAQDFLREVVAHEVGHTLGFRHNFAGSLGSNEPLALRAQHLKHYFNGEAIDPELSVTSSIMDYLPFEEVPLAGSLIGSSAAPIFSYDQLVVDHLYKDKDFNWRDAPTFCTDSHLISGSYADCAVFDMGGSLVEYAIWNQNNQLNSLALALLSRFAVAKKPPGNGRPLGVENVALNPTARADQILDGNYPILQMLDENGHLIATHREFSVVTPLNAKEVKLKALKKITTELEEVGGFSALFPQIPADFASQQFDRFTELLNQNSNFEFTPEERIHIESTVARFYEVLQARLMVTYLNQWALEPSVARKKAAKKPLAELKLMDHPINQQFADFLVTRIKPILFQQQSSTSFFFPLTRAGGSHVNDSLYSSEHFKLNELKNMPLAMVLSTVLDTKSDPAEEFNLPQFRFGTAYRIKASQILSTKKSKQPGWGLHHRYGLRQEMSQLIKVHFPGKGVEELKAERFEPSVARWIIINQRIYSNLRLR